MEKGRLSRLKGLVRKGIVALACAGFGLLCAQGIECVDSDNIDEAYIDKELRALIYGADCADSVQIAPRSTSPKGAINANNNATIDSTKYPDTKSRTIAFGGSVLYGGIFDGTSNANAYLSADRKISYTLTSGTLDSGTLEVKAICEKQGFRIANFRNGDFNIYLSKNPTKEVAIALNVNTSMSGYIEAFKEIAPFVAKHILGDREKQFAKISLITFSYSWVYDLGTFYDAQEFANALEKAKGIKSDTVVFNHALIKSMKNFTKDNGLKKEVYLITNGSPGDMLKADKMLAMIKNLNANITKNTATNADNRVKIHAFALSPNLEFLKNVAKITGGTYNEANNSYDFKKQILTLSNGGKPFDMGDIDNQIRPSKTHKIYDPDNPQDKPK